MGAFAVCLLKICTNHLLSKRHKTATIPIHRLFFIRQHHINVSLVFIRSFSPEMRYFFLTYTKYACEKLPFSDAKSLAECSPLNYTVLP